MRLTVRLTIRLPKNLLCAALFTSLVSASPKLSIPTTVGTAVGFINGSTPSVRQWTGIPFAEPPLGSLRFMPPVAKTPADIVEATYKRPSCALWLSKLPSIMNTLVTEFNPPPPYSEDCLYLNVFSPVKAKNASLPVFIWVHGGAFTFGGIETPYEQPQQWVERTKDHIVVQVNYRLNIFGFPNARGLNESKQNVGFLDLRLAVEWVRDNIANFGGDPSHMVLWGQSAGSGLVESFQFAYPSDPIVSGSICESGVALMVVSHTDTPHSNFTFVAGQMGCPAGSSAAEELACMQKVSASSMERFLEMYSDNKTMPALVFSPVADGEYIFTPAEYTALADAGNFSKLPLLLGTNAQEGSSFVPFSISGVNATPAAVEALTEEIFQCKTRLTCKNREAGGATTFRYQYWGNFSNISPEPWMGAYHFAELPLIMGSHPNYRGDSTPFEYSLSHKMQDMWLAFAKSPQTGLLAHGWPAYSDNGSAVILGKDNVLMQLESVQTLDAACTAS